MTQMEQLIGALKALHLPELTQDPLAAEGWLEMREDPEDKRPVTGYQLEHNIGRRFVIPHSGEGFDGFYASFRFDDAGNFKGYGVYE